MDVRVLVVDGGSKLPPEANSAIVVGGSNAVIYAAYFSAPESGRQPLKWHAPC